MKLFRNFRFICMLFVAGSMFIFSCSKLENGNEISPLGTSNTFEEARFKEFDLIKSDKVNAKNAIVFDDKNEAYSFLKKLKSFKSGSEEQNKFVTDILLKSLQKHNPEQYNLVLQSLPDGKMTQSTNEDEGALPDYGPRYRNPCTNALMEGNGLRVSLFANMGFHAQTDASGHITSVGTDINGFVVGISNGNSYFNTPGSTYDPATGTYRVEGSVSINYNLFIEGIGTYYTLNLRGILTIKTPRGGCGSSQYNVDFEMTE